MFGFSSQNHLHSIKVDGRPISILPNNPSNSIHSQNAILWHYFLLLSLLNAFSTCHTTLMFNLERKKTKHDFGISYLLIVIPTHRIRHYIERNYLRNFANIFWCYGYRINSFKSIYTYCLLLIISFVTS